MSKWQYLSLQEEQVLDRVFCIHLISVSQLRTVLNLFETSGQPDLTARIMEDNVKRNSMGVYLLVFKGSSSVEVRHVIRPGDVLIGELKAHTGKYPECECFNSESAREAYALELRMLEDFGGVYTLDNLISSKTSIQ